MDLDYRDQHLDDDDSEDEVFFGPITEKEKRKINQCNSRRQTTFGTTRIQSKLAECAGYASPSPRSPLLVYKQSAGKSTDLAKDEDNSASATCDLQDNNSSPRVSELRDITAQISDIHIVDSIDNNATPLQPDAGVISVVSRDSEVHSNYIDSTYPLSSKYSQDSYANISGITSLESSHNPGTESQSHSFIVEQEDARCNQSTEPLDLSMGVDNRVSSNLSGENDEENKTDEDKLIDIHAVDPQELLEDNINQNLEKSIALESIQEHGDSLKCIEETNNDNHVLNTQDINGDVLDIQKSESMISSNNNAVKEESSDNCSKSDSIVSTSVSKKRPRESYFSTLEVINICEESLSTEIESSAEDKNSFNDATVPVIIVTEQQSSITSDEYSYSEPSDVTCDKGMLMSHNSEPTISSDNSQNTNSLNCVKETSFENDCFNDTLEDMELFMKYGPNYDEIIKSQKKEYTSSCESSIELDYQRNSKDSKLSLASVNSMGSFQPIMNSTSNQTPSTESMQEHNQLKLLHSKDGDLRELELNGLDLCDNESFKSIERINNSKEDNEKNEPPPKPPRKMDSPCLTNDNEGAPYVMKDNSYENTQVGRESSFRNNTQGSSSSQKSRIASLSKLPVSSRVTSDIQHTKSNNMNSGKLTTVAALQTPQDLSKKIVTEKSSSGTLKSRVPYKSPFATPKCPTGHKSPFVTPKASTGQRSLFSTPTSQKSTFATPKCPTSQKSPYITKSLSTHKSLTTPNKPQPTPSSVSYGSLRKTDTKTPSSLRRVPSKSKMNSNGLSIVSPVARYLKENPPPPLITIVKPKHKLSPEMIRESYTSSSDKLPLTPKNILHSKEIQSENNKSSNALDKGLKKVRNCPLPMIKYSTAEFYKLEESKENRDHRREIPTKNQPAIVIKHKGRMKVATDNIKDDVSDLTKSSPQSLVEISVLESHEARLK